MQVHRPAEIGALIRAERKGQGLRQDELALVAGTGRRFISDIENGKPTARLGEVLDVLLALGCRIEITGPQLVGERLDGDS